MVREDGWREVHRLFHVERRSKAEIARQLDLDRKTVRGILQEAAWQPYTRAERADTVLAEHARYLETRAPQVQYSARILLFDHLIRPRQQRRRDREAEGLGGLEVDDQLELRGLFDRKIGRAWPLGGACRRTLRPGERARVDAGHRT